ncbi:MAG: peptidoglycan editing factor PgeF [Sphingomonas sp.]|uniref:peptidoglycan editing factor PgeF n=1 Tax=Sphingomonas sp. TaxID=28214 RepID=UPI001ACF4DEC|nr:peptidoglycan editing factor PgeF [Sphingomonas sp.]MBN8808604.1 peptidoglycan editing factor PgeF [Sphingomonas sp.]
MSEVEVNRAGVLAGVAHGFLGRRGGASTGLYAGLNVGTGSDDEPATIAENRRRAVAAVLPGARLVQPYQIHSADCVTVVEPWNDAMRPHADAVVTATPGLALGIVTADCVPVLFADREAGVVGAAHAGWKGAIGGVTDATLLAMESLGARRERIAAAIGPCIRQPSYEVDAAFRQRFVAADSANARFFASGRADHVQFDLPGYVAARLAADGVGAVETLDLDTYPLEDRFYSFRRATHRGEPGYGRQISIIGLEI